LPSLAAALTHLSAAAENPLVTFFSFFSFKATKHSQDRDRLYGLCPGCFCGDALKIRDLNSNNRRIAEQGQNRSLSRLLSDALTNPLGRRRFFFFDLSALHAPKILAHRSVFPGLPGQENYVIVVAMLSQI
jgi:hypothetical protein